MSVQFSDFLKHNRPLRGGAVLLMSQVIGELRLERFKIYSVWHRQQI